MKAVQVSEAGGDFQTTDLAQPEPEGHQVRVSVEACGICHSDVFVKDGLFPGIDYPRVPGHEVIGRIDAVGADVAHWEPGQRVGIGWHGGHCFDCASCRQGDFVNCKAAEITGLTYDGGYAEQVLAPDHALAAVPDDLDPADAAPLMCAGVTTFNALRNSGAQPGELVAVQGVGGLGHLGIQFARAMGTHTVALSRGEAKRELATDLGAHRYVDTTQDDPVEALQALGGARVVLATAPEGPSMTPLVDGLSVNGVLLTVGVSDQPLEVAPLQLIAKRRRIQGWPSGHAKDSEETLEFAALHGVRPLVERYALADAATAYERMMNNAVRFRAVLVP